MNGRTKREMATVQAHSVSFDRVIDIHGNQGHITAYFAAGGRVQFDLGWCREKFDPNKPMYVTLWQEGDAE